jgi:hypothetical protein
MADEIPTALIGAVSGALGGVAVVIARYLFEDRNAARAEARANTRNVREIRRERLHDLASVLAGASPDGDYTASAERDYRRLPTLAASIGDPALSEYIGRMNSSDRGSAPWRDAYGDARQRTGELSREVLDR